MIPKYEPINQQSRVGWLCQFLPSFFVHASATTMTDASCPETKRAKTWHIPASEKAKRTHNPIRAIVDTIDLSKKNPDKEFIPLSLGMCLVCVP